jgi:hypothetical protein
MATSVPSASIAFDFREIDALRERYGLLQAEMRLVIKTAKNATARWGRTRTREATSRVLNVKKKVVADAVRYEPAKTAEDDAVVTISRQPVDLAEFKAKATKKRGTTVQLDQTRPALVFKHAFKARMKSGHIGFFLRQKLSAIGQFTTAQDLMRAGFKEDEAFSLAGGKDITSHITGQVIGKTSRSPLLKKLEGRGYLSTRRGNRFPGLTSRGYAERLPIEELHGPPVISRLVDDNRAARLTQLANTTIGDIRQRFSKEVESKVQWILSGKAATVLQRQELAESTIDAGRS